MADRHRDVEPLWRDVLGRRLRETRRRQGRTLADAARRAGISTQYLSEVERGRKDASSEIIAAIAGALGYALGEMAWMAAADLLAANGLTAAGHPALEVGPRLRLVRPIGALLSRADPGGSGAGSSMGTAAPTGPVALAA